MRTIQDIKLIPIRDYLAQWGIVPKPENTRYGFYLSPLREEQDASSRWTTRRTCGMTSVQVVVARLSTL